ncbi:hypothetical protein [Microbacterium istanbulense]|uniref:Glycosyltransferase n=1 Tax=Microbacterium istanbulense TaxID=3122049 RepID=A0ABU8LHA1_9MICO
MERQHDHVHFWTRQAGATDSWDPDADPHRHLTAYGHAFLELFQRMRSEGRRVSIGHRPPTGTTSVVTAMEELIAHQPQIPARNIARLGLALLPMLGRPPSIVVLRVDTWHNVAAPEFVTLEAMPTRGSQTTPRQRALPLLPQRGLVPRNEARGDRVETVALKAYSYNIPSWIDDDFVRALEGSGMRLRVDTELSGRWADFENVDVVLCTHAEGTDERVKPPTKLVAAWRAGVIPVCGPYLGYREVGEPGENMVVARADAESFLAALRALRDDPALVRRLRQAIPRAAADYAPERVVDANWRAFTEAPAVERWALVRAVARALPIALVGRLRRFLAR